MLKNQIKNKRGRLIASLLGLCFLFIIINLGTRRQIAVDRVQAAGDVLAVARAAADASEADRSITNCRYGIISGYDLEQHVARIGAGWHLDFNPPRFSPATGNNAEFAQTLLVFQNKTEDGQYLPGYRTAVPLDADFAAYIRANTGDLWLIGNEVDRGPNPDKNWSGQGDMYPHVYAQAFHEVRTFIKQHDPTARIAISALVQVTPGRLQYLDKVWQAYQQRYGAPMPVDVWNMHVYVLPEVEPDGITPNGIASVAVGTDPTLGKRSSGGSPQACTDPDVYCYAEHDSIEIFNEQVLAMRRWMKAHGQQQKPLILSEFSLLFPNIEEGETCFLQDEYGNCFTPNRVTSYMTKAFNYLNTLKNEDLGYALDGNRLVQQWAWFSVFTDTVGTVSNILESDQQTLSQVGKAYQQKVFTEPPTVNLVVEDIPRVYATVDKTTEKATANLRVTFRNNGNTAINKPFNVTFYLDPGRTKPFATVPISETVRGCATNVYTAEFAWPSLKPGVYFYWLALDSGGVIAETPAGPSDNLGFGLVVVHSKGSYMPLMMR